MKKIFFTIAIIITVVLSANAQMDGFFNSNAEDYSSSGRAGTMPLLPQGAIGTTDNDQPATAPLGSGLLILTTLGSAYFLKKKFKK